MIIKEGNVLKIKHDRKGTIMVIAERDFDPENEEFYPVKAAEAVNGIHTVKKWLPGDHVPCKRSLCTIKEIVSPIN